MLLNDSSGTNQKDVLSYSLNLTNQDSYVRLVHEKNKTIASLQAVPSPSCAHFDFPSLLRPATQAGCFVVHVRRTRKGERRAGTRRTAGMGGGDAFLLFFCVFVFTPPTPSKSIPATLVLYYKSWKAIHLLIKIDSTLK